VAYSILLIQDEIVTNYAAWKVTQISHHIFKIGYNTGTQQNQRVNYFRAHIKTEQKQKEGKAIIVKMIDL